MARLKLRGKRIIVTGAGRGLGLCLIRRLINREEALVIAVDIRQDLLSALEEEFKHTKPGALTTLQADLEEDDQPVKIFNQAITTGQVFGIINNAGIADSGITNISRADIYERINTINFLAPMKLSLLFLDYFESMGSGAILNIGSMAGFVPVPYQNAYAASKHALSAFTLALRAERRLADVTITLMAPGGILTPMVREAGLVKIFLGKALGLSPPETVAKRTLKHWKARRRLGFFNLLEASTAVIYPILPKALVYSSLERFYRPMDS